MEWGAIEHSAPHVSLATLDPDARTSRPLWPRRQSKVLEERAVSVGCPDAGPRTGAQSIKRGKVQWGRVASDRGARVTAVQMQNWGADGLQVAKASTWLGAAMGPNDFFRATPASQPQGGAGQGRGGERQERESKDGQMQ